MNYTMQKQHFHKAKLLSLFWSNNIKSNRTDLTYGLKWNDYLYSYIQGENKKISQFVEEKRAEKFMFSYLIFTETETTLNVGIIENEFEALCVKLIEQEKNIPNSIFKYFPNYQEINIIIKFFTLQYVRNPDRYTHYLNLYFSHLLIQKKPHNPYFFDLFDFRNFEKLLLFINNQIISDYYSFLNTFNEYSFEIFQNINNNNILTDNTVVTVNHNDYFKMIFADKFSEVSHLLNNTHIITISSKYFLIFYPKHISSSINTIKELYLEHQNNIDLFFCRNIIFSKYNELSFLNNVENFVKKYGSNHNFLKYYMDMNFSINQFENHLQNFYLFHKKGFSFLK